MRARCSGRRSAWTAERPRAGCRHGARPSSDGALRPATPRTAVASADAIGAVEPWPDHIRKGRTTPAEERHDTDAGERDICRLPTTGTLCSPHVQHPRRASPPVARHAEPCPTDAAGAGAGRRARGPWRPRDAAQGARGGGLALGGSDATARRGPGVVPPAACRGPLLGRTHRPGRHHRIRHLVRRADAAAARCGRHLRHGSARADPVDLAAAHAPAGARGRRRGRDEQRPTGRTGRRAGGPRGGPALLPRGRVLGCGGLRTSRRDARRVGRPARGPGGGRPGQGRRRRCAPVADRGPRLERAGLDAGHGRHDHVGAGRRPGRRAAPHHPARGRRRARRHPGRPTRRVPRRRGRPARRRGDPAPPVRTRAGGDRTRRRRPHGLGAVGPCGALRPPRGPRLGPGAAARAGRRAAARAGPDRRRHRSSDARRAGLRTAGRQPGVAPRDPLGLPRHGSLARGRRPHALRAPQHRPLSPAARRRRDRLGPAWTRASRYVLQTALALGRLDAAEARPDVDL